ncbi:MAG: two-component sensor histidine kinase [Clostridia bacterium]|nr:two-component sensor histidine kinase [Clostridia bacterium]
MNTEEIISVIKTKIQNIKDSLPFPKNDEHTVGENIKDLINNAKDNVTDKLKDKQSKIKQFDISNIPSYVRSLPTKIKERGQQKHSLMTWLSISFVSFSLIILVILLSFQTLFFGSFYKAIKTKNLTASAQSIIANIDNERINELMDTVSSLNDVNIILCKHDAHANYQKTYSSLISENCEINSLSTEKLNDYFVRARNNSGSYIAVIDTPAAATFDFDDKKNGFVGQRPPFENDKAEKLIFAAAFTDSDGVENLLLLESVVTASLNTKLTLMYQLRIIIVILIIISVIMTVIFSTMIAKPIEHINNSAKELAEGNYDVVFRGSGYREVEQLSDTLNYAKTELQQVDQMRKDLIANVSHDLRTPLTLITGYGEVMKDIPGENTPENIQIIIDEATRLTSLVNDLIDISKIEAGTMKLEATTFCLTETIQEMFGRYNKLKEQDGFSFTFEHDQNVYVYADQLKISQVVYNLVNNAVNYASDSKEITVRQICYDNRVRIEVIDNGPGIPPDKLKNIWDRYYKVDKSHRSAKIGTGLGLSIVKTVLKLHKAQYGVFSKVGKGTVFWFELYRTDENGEPM